MLNFTDWCAQTIRQDESRPIWLEERKFEWIPLVQNTLYRIFSGETLILITDSERDWFAKYVISHVNKSKHRPLVPIISIKSLFPRIEKSKEQDVEIMLVNDFLDTLFQQRCFFWYVGKNNTLPSKLALSREGGFLWIFDEELQNSFTLQSIDLLVDLKLMQMYRIFELSLEAAMFGKVNLE